MKKATIFPCVHYEEILEFVFSQKYPGVELKDEWGITEDNTGRWSVTCCSVQLQSDLLYDSGLNDVVENRVQSIVTRLLPEWSYYRQFAEANDLTGSWYIIFTD